MCVLKWYNFAAVLLFTCISKLVHGKLKEPDYDSGWVLINSANSWPERGKAMRTFKHDFDESPLLVDVQVKAVDGPNKGFIFPGTGHVIRDDDRDYPFGNVAYIYDNTSIMVSAPIQNNDILGYCIYTGFSTYWEGPADQKSYSALVRARAWRAGSMPKPDFTSRGIKLTAASGRREDSYVSVHHGLSAHPSLVISRIRFPQRGNYPNFYADSVGSGSVIYTSYADDDRNGYVIYGFDYSSIRVWVPSRPWGFLFSGADGGAGFGIYGIKVKSAFLELYAWREESLTPSFTLKKTLSPGRISSSDLTMHFNQERAENETFTRAWVQAIDGVNSGYRFVGNGALAYDTYNVSTPCSYGGLVYAYTNSTMRFWKPGTATNGALICLQDKLGEGTNTQASSHGIAIVKSWQLVKADQKVWLDSPVAGNCRGETVLTCHFSDIPLSTWTWSRKYGDSWSTFMENGTQIGPNPSSVREEMNVSFSLIIEGADNMARGWYKCGVGQYASEEKWLDMECKPECAAVYLTPEKHLEIVLANVHPIPKIDFILKDQAFKDVAIDFQRYCGGNRWTLTCRWISTTPLQDGQYFYRLVATTVTDTLFIGTIN